MFVKLGLLGILTEAFKGIYVMVCDDIEKLRGK
jgi:hypothetical protein